VKRRRRRPFAIGVGLVLAALAWAAAGSAWAHPLAPALLELREAAGGEVGVRFKRPRAPLGAAPLEARVPDGCTRTDGEASWGEAGSRVETWLLDCGPAGLAGRTIEVSGLETAEAGVVVRIERADGRSVRSLLSPASPRFRIPERESTGAVLWGYGRLGFHHIGAGLDHLLFVLGLVFLAGGGRRLLLTVTAFTFGHSVTLALAALQVVRLAPEPVEVGIAASLLWLAVELARPGGARRASAPLAAGFGLLHGLGFAGALQAAGLPAGAVPLALLGFNLGIEAGQLVFVTILLATGATARALLGARGETLTRPARLASAYALGTVAAYWTFERLAALA